MQFLVLPTQQLSFPAVPSLTGGQWGEAPATGHKQKEVLACPARRPFPLDVSREGGQAPSGFLLQAWLPGIPALLADFQTDSTWETEKSPAAFHPVRVPSTRRNPSAGVWT